MAEAIQKELAMLGKQVQALAIPDASKQTALWCIKQLPSPYESFRLTNESRYGDQITRLLDALLKELGEGETATKVAERIRLLHEKLGLPVLHLRTSRISSPRSRKARLSV